MPKLRAAKIKGFPVDIYYAL